MYIICVYMCVCVCVCGYSWFVLNILSCYVVLLASVYKTELSK